MEDKMDYKDTPSAKLLNGSYNQTYIISARGTDDDRIEANDVLFKCGNWCYKGAVQFNGLKFKLDEIPVIIPTLQRQQGSLRYYCTAKSIPEDSEYHLPMQYIEDAVEFIASELASEALDKELRKMANIFPWIEEDDAATYFELSIGKIPDFMNKIEIIASKTYARGLILVSIYYDRCLYCCVQNGEGDQPLLDVRFPNVAHHGQGLLLNTYNDDHFGWKKLTLWHIVDSGEVNQKKDIPKIKTINVSTANYEQTYCILKSSIDPKSPLLSVYHDALFRFGSWCYSGRVQLTQNLTLSDVPYVIPALRMQQSRLDFYCDVNNFPINSPYAGALEYVKKISPLVEIHITRSEESLKSLIDRLSNMGLGESVTKWLEGDPANSFFEFKLSPSKELQDSMKNVEMIVSKCYHGSGIITIMIIFEFTVYVSISETKDENPLLDSRFPDVSGKGRGYQIEAYNSGTDDWDELRKVSVWQTVGALEQEFREKAAQFAQSKNSSNTETGHNSDDERDSARAEDKEDKTEKQSSPTIAATVHHQPPQQHHLDNKLAKEEAPSEPSSVNPSNKENLEFKSESKTIPADLSPMKIRQALPHHIPKMEGLSSKLDDIRKNLGDGGLKAPWDLKGRPLGQAPLGKK